MKTINKKKLFRDNSIQTAEKTYFLLKSGLEEALSWYLTFL